MTAPMYVVTDPQLVKQLCVKDFDSFSDHRVLLDDTVDKLFGKALISLRGDEWKGKKHLKMTKQFFSNRFSYRHAINIIARFHWF